MCMKQSKFCVNIIQVKKYKKIASQNTSMCLLPNFYQYPDIYGSIYFLLLMILYGLSTAKLHTVTKHIYIYFLSIKDRFW